MLRHGWDAEALQEKFQDMHPDMDAKEIHATVKSAVRIAKMEQTEFDKGEYALKMRALMNIKLGAKADLPRILEQYTWSLADMQQFRPGVPLHDQRVVFLMGMFAQDEVVWIGDKWHSGLTKRESSRPTPPKIPQNSRHFMNCQSWLLKPKIIGEFTSASTFKPGTYQRTITQVVQRKYMVVESDVLSIDQIGAIFRYLQEEGEMKLYAIVSTGGKSLHGWFEWGGDEVADEWQAKLEGLSCDPANLRPSQPVRLPGCIRKDTKRPQELLYYAG